MSLAEASRRLFCDRRTMAMCMVNERPVGHRRGQPVWSLAVCRRKLGELRQARAALSIPRSRVLRLQAEKLEYQVALLRRGYVPITDVERWGAQLEAAVRKVIGQFHLLAPSLVGSSIPEAEARLKAVELDALRQLGDFAAG